MNIINILKKIKKILHIHVLFRSTCDCNHRLRFLYFLFLLHHFLGISLGPPISQGTIPLTLISSLCSHDSSGDISGSPFSITSSGSCRLTAEFKPSHNCCSCEGSTGADGLPSAAGSVFVGGGHQLWVAEAGPGCRMAGIS